MNEFHIYPSLNPSTKSIVTHFICILFICVTFDDGVCTIELCCRRRRRLIGDTFEKITYGNKSTSLRSKTSFAYHIDTQTRTFVEPFSRSTSFNPMYEIRARERTRAT